MIRYALVFALVAFPAAAQPILSCTFTASTGAQVARSAGPDLSLLANGAIWDQRAQDYLEWRAEQRLGTPPANVGQAIQSWVDEIYLDLRGGEKAYRTGLAVEAAETAEDVSIPDE